jgi:hypothetical protein
MERDHFEDLGVDGRVILKGVETGNRMGGCGLDSSVSG